MFSRALSPRGSRGRLRWVAIAILGVGLGSASAMLAAPGAGVLLGAAGDIACAPTDPNFNGGAGNGAFCRMAATSDLLLARGAGLAAALALGDNQYDVGALAAFQESFGPSWGRLLPRLHPVVGNHEYLTPSAAGYFAYFGAAAGDPAEGYYSFDLGAWHVAVLNSNCGAVGGCGDGSPQVDWLRADLAAHPSDCALVAWHHPRFSSGQHGDDPIVETLWRAAQQGGADVVLVGHDHLYERFAPQDATGRHDVVGGLREFVVGTGGRNLTPVATVRAQSLVRITGVFGVLFLSLRDSGYDWSFEGIQGGPALDSGSAECHPRPRGFYPIPACRLLDTRQGGQGPALGFGQPRTIQFTGRCGIPGDAQAVTANFTVVGPSATGVLAVYPEGGDPTGSTVVAARAGRTRAGFASLGLGEAGALAARLDAASGVTSGAGHLVVDVSGYFR
jgi:acid phosphatase type 7